MRYQPKAVRRDAIESNMRQAATSEWRSIVQWSLGATIAALVLFAGAVSLPSLALAGVVGPVATKATCGKNDRTESGLQGQTTLAERYAAAGGFKPYNCNLQLQGQSTGDGASMGMAVTDRCAYYSQWIAPELPTVLDNPGTVVVDVADPKNPKIARYLKTPGMLNPNEFLILSLKSNLLIAQASDQTLELGKTIDIYDISDCLKPVLKFSGIIPGVILHTGDFSKDGRTFYTAPSEDKEDTIWALDLADPSSPKIIAQWKPTDPKISRFHHISISDDGNTAYVDIGRHYPRDLKTRKAEGPNQGMGILDISEVQARKPNPQIKLIGGPLFWDDTTHGQYERPMVVKGHKYVWLNDMDGSIPTGFVVPTGRVFVGNLASRSFEGVTTTPEEACRQNPEMPGWGYVSIVNVDDPAHISRVSGLRLEVNEPKNCLAVSHDPAYTFAYAPRICDVDNYQDAKMIVCGWGDSGVRVFDIRDVAHPRELAYFKPAAVGNAPRKASEFQTFRETKTFPEAKFHTTDGVIYAFFANDAKEVWFTSFDGGFQVVRFSDELMAREKDIFSRDVTCGGKRRGPQGCP